MMCGKRILLRLFLALCLSTPKIFFAASESERFRQDFLKMFPMRMHYNFEKAEIYDKQDMFVISCDEKFQDVKIDLFGRTLRDDDLVAKLEKEIKKIDEQTKEQNKKNAEIDRRLLEEKRATAFLVEKELQAYYQRQKNNG
jgi:hypothetical protein